MTSQSFTMTVEGLKAEAEGAVENAFQDAKNRVTKLADTITNAGNIALGSLQTASSYITGLMRKEMNNAINAAQAQFTAIKSTFQTDISGVANSFITFVQTQIGGFVSGAQSDLADVDTLRTNLVSDLDSAVDSAKADLENAKTKLKSDLDAVTSYAKAELAKIEARASSLASTFYDIVIRFVGAAIILGAGFLVFEIIRKNIDAEHEARVAHARNSR